MIVERLPVPLLRPLFNGWYWRRTGSQRNPKYRVRLRGSNEVSDRESDELHTVFLHTDTHKL